MNDYTEQPLRIKNKLLKAKGTDIHFKVFGSGSHRYEINPPVSIAQIEGLEKKFGIQLPKCYRSFVLKVGNGGRSFLNSGAGPYYGIYPLGTNIDQLMYSNVEEHLKKDCCLYPNMSETFWDNLTDPLYEEDIPDDDFSNLVGKIYGGILPIGSQGCSYIHALVLNGPHRGKVVNMDMGEQMVPRFSFENNFLDWYERWLDEIISGELTKKSPSWYGYSRKSDL